MSADSDPQVYLAALRHEREHKARYRAKTADIDAEIARVEAEIAVAAGEVQELADGLNAVFGVTTEPAKAEPKRSKQRKGD
jgi:hypothetical protein